MNERTSTERSSDFARWLRTGRRPPLRNSDGVELKFNPWHDPADGRFTFAGAGSRFAAGGSGSNDRAGKRALQIDRRTDAQSGRSKPASASRPREEPNAAVEFVGGVAEGVHDVAKEAIEGVRSILTTNPVTTVRNVAYGAAGVVDAATASENTPALKHIARGREALANASARDVGRATGAAVGNVALTVAPGAAFSKVAALRRLRAVPPRVTYDPPQIGWVKERLKETTQSWKAYNDSADGARSGYAPTLMRPMPDGSFRPVKFDGVRGDYVIDRKWSIRDMKNARDQVIRQSEALAHNRLIGVWEVPNARQKAKALKLLRKMKVVNIQVRVVKP